VDSAEELPAEENREEASPKVLRHLQRESTMRELKNKKSPQKVPRMKRVQLCQVQIRITKA